MSQESMFWSGCDSIVNSSNVTISTFVSMMFMMFVEERKQCKIRVKVRFWCHKKVCLVQVAISSNIIISTLVQVIYDVFSKERFHSTSLHRNRSFLTVSFVAQCYNFTSCLSQKRTVLFAPWVINVSDGNLWTWTYILRSLLLLPVAVFLNPFRNAELIFIITRRKTCTVLLRPSFALSRLHRFLGDSKTA